MGSVPQLGSLYNHHIIRIEDFDEGESETARRDTDEEHFEQYEQPARDLTSILHPIGLTAHYLRHMLTQWLHVQLSRWIYHMQSRARSGHKWRKAVDHFWNLAVDNIREGCILKMLLQKDQRYVHRDSLEEVTDFILNILHDNSMWSTLLFYPNFAAMLKARVHTDEPTMDIPATRTAQRVFDLNRRS